MSDFNEKFYQLITQKNIKSSSCNPYSGNFIIEIEFLISSFDETEDLNLYQVSSSFVIKVTGENYGKTISLLFEEIDKFEQTGIKLRMENNQ